MLDKIKIEQINHRHIETLQQIGRQTFEETFAESNSAENMAKYLEEGYSHEKLNEELNNQTSFFSSLALNSFKIFSITLMPSFLRAL